MCFLSSDRREELARKNGTGEKRHVTDKVLHRKPGGTAAGRMAIDAKDARVR